MRRLSSGAWFCLLVASCLAACAGQLRSAGGPEAESSAVAWAHIPAGSFEMGCSEGDDDCMPDERPRRHVEVGAFDLATTETTQAEYAAVTGERPSTFAGCDACPVETITWDEALAFCNTIGGRLPTEAEWEYAARAGRAGSPRRADRKSLGEVAWYEGSAQGKTHPVGLLSPNAFGLYDMQGNVLEPVADRYVEDAYKAQGGQPMGRPHGLRGGAYSFPEVFTRVSLRNHDEEKVVKPSQRGVRCARDAR